MTALPTSDPGPDEPFEVIHLGGEAVPAAFRRHGVYLSARDLEAA